MTRRRFSEKDTIRTLIHQGVEICCFRTGEPITLQNVTLLEREHLHERKLGGPDTPGNCRYSLKAAHHVVTNGTKATTAGSSKHRIAKSKRIVRECTFKVKKRRPGARKPKSAWPSRKMPSRPFPKRKAS